MKRLGYPRIRVVPLIGLLLLIILLTPVPVESGRTPCPQGGGGGALDGLLNFVLPVVRACPAPPPADPAIAFIQPGTVNNLMVMNVDGSNKAVVFSGWEFCLLTTTSWSPSGKSIVFINNCDPDGSHFTLWRVDVTVVNGVPQGSNPRQLSIACRPCAGPAWSPTANVVAVTSNYASVLMVDADNGGVLQTLYTPPAGSMVNRMAWSSDGGRLAVGERDAGGVDSIRILDAVTGSILRTLVQGVFDSITFIDWARQGVDKLAIKGDIGTDSSVYTIEFASASETVIRVLAGNSPAWSPDNTKLAFMGSTQPGNVKTVNLATGKITDLKINGNYIDWRRF